MSEDKIIADAVNSLVEAIMVLPMGAVVYALSGWWGLLAFCVGWALMGVGKAAFRVWRLRP